jgi:predicted ATPase
VQPDLPTGTVTFLFTDIAGATLLLQKLGDGYADVLAEHHRTLRDAWRRHGGVEVDTQGDAFFVAFARSSDAVAAAIDAQHVLAGGPVRVRMGLHTGEPALSDEGYVGLDVHRAARIAAAGHGGQVLLSQATAELASADVRDLGLHRLKDLSAPERLFQLGTEDFPPLKTLNKTNLPVPATLFLGREREIEQLAALMRRPDVRLVTLTGPGGSGKTRLALQAAGAAADDYDRGVWWVSLASLADPALVETAAAQVLGSKDKLSAAVADQRLLLVLDNFEHLLDAAGGIAATIELCSQLTVLVTSREPLHVDGEWEIAVDPLREREAVELFVQRALAVRSDFAANGEIAEICRRLDCLPLAIELAAARCGLLSPGEIAVRLDTARGALGVGARDAPARQRTLRATIDWSHDLLADDEKQCFARFAVFAAGATVGAAETIIGTGLDTLDGLVVKSLLVRRQHALAPTRLGMLETIRDYASERLAAAADKDAVHQRHYRYFLALAQEHGTDRVLMRAGRSKHLARLDADIDNLHAALGWAVGRPDAGPALSLCAALRRYWRMRYRDTDAVGWTEQALNLPGADAHPAMRVRVLGARAGGLWHLGREGEAASVFGEAETVARRLGDPAVLSGLLEGHAIREAMARRGRVADALADEALHYATTAGDDWAMATAAWAKAMAASTTAELRDRVDWAASLLDDVGNVFRLASLYGSAAYAALEDGSDRDAREFIDSALAIAHELDDPFAWMATQGNLGLTALLTGDTSGAGRAFREELALCRELGAHRFVDEGVRGLAAVAVVRGDVHRAARLVGAAGAHRFGQPEDPVHARLDATFFDPARTRHGPDAWDAAARGGATLSVEDAIAYALEEPRA